DRGVDLPCDLGDRQPIGDGQMEVDRELAVQRQTDALAADAQAVDELAERPVTPEARHAIHAPRRVSDTRAEGAARDERASGDRVGGHAERILLRGPWRGPAR